MDKKKIIFGSVFALFMVVSCAPTKTKKTSNTMEPEKEYTGANIANGVFNFSGESYDEKAKILGQLESYAMNHHLAGIPLYDDAGYEMFSPRIQLMSNTYVPNYGFGVGESTLNPTGNMFNGSPIDSKKVSYPSYFQSYATEDSGTYNYWNSSGSDVAGKSSMICSSYFSTRMNSDKTGYEWEGELCRDDKPIALDENGNALTEAQMAADGFTCKFWRVRLYTGENAAEGRKFQYSTSPESKWKSKYDGRAIKLEDYLTPFKTMLGKSLSRASGLIDEASGFYGASNYLYAGADDKDWGVEIHNGPTTDKSYFDGVGIKLNSAECSIDFKFITPITRFYAMYNTASSLYSPIPAEFIEDVGVANFGTIGKSTDPKKNCDNLISTGAYNVISWEKEKETVYQKNSTYNREDRIKFEGYVETGYKDEEAAWQGFKNGVIDNITVPSKYVSEYASNPYAHKTEGSTVIKINVNSCTEWQWQKYFGTKGTAYPHANEENYWDVKPIMSNDDFLTGLYFCINRSELAEMTGHNPAYAYLSDAYKTDPENNISYRDTAAGKAVTARYENVKTNGVKGYSPAMAQTMFESAIKDLVASGDYDEDDEITLSFWWRKDENLQNIGNTLKAYMEKPFNDAAKKLGYGMTLEIDNKVAGSSYTDAYSKMDQGEFDFAEGAISGNVLNPLAFMSVISSNSSLSQGFTTNWGDDTALVSAENPCMYNGLAWSYDALQVAANGAAVVEKGHNVEPLKSNNAPTEDECFIDKKGNINFCYELPNIYDEDGNLAIDLTLKSTTLICGPYGFSTGLDIVEGEPEIDENTGFYIVKVAKRTMDMYAQYTATETGTKIDSVGLIVIVDAYFKESGVEKTAQAQMTVKLSTLELDPYEPAK